MIIVLDANIIIRDFRRAGSHFQTLYDGVESGAHSICVPAVVVDETIRKFREELQERLAQVKRNVLRGRRLSEDFPPFEVEDAWVEREIEKYRNSLEKELAAHDARVLPYPTVEHRELVERELAHKRPFSPRGGYRDALIWLSVIDLAKTADDRVVPVTENTRDFADASGNLHEDLVQDLRDRGLGDNDVTLAIGLRDAVERFVEPSLARLEELRMQLKNGVYKGVDIKEAVGLALQEDQAGHEWDPEELGFEAELESPTLAWVVGDFEFEINEVLGLSGGRALAAVAAEFECEFHVFIYKSNYWAMDEDEYGVSVWNTDWNEWYVAGTKYGNVSVEAKIILDIETGEIKSIEFDDVSGSPG